MWLVILWTLIAAIGLAASVTTYWDAVTFIRFLKSNAKTASLVAAYRVEVFREAISVAAQSINLTIGLLALFTYGQVTSHGIISLVSTVGLMLVALLLMAFSLVNYVIRHRKVT